MTGPKRSSATKLELESMHSREGANNDGGQEAERAIVIPKAVLTHRVEVVVRNINKLG